MDERRDPGAPGLAEEHQGSADIHPGRRFGVRLGVRHRGDRRQVDDPAHPVEGAPRGGRVRDVALAHLDAGQAVHPRALTGGEVVEDPDRVAPSGEPGDEVAADEPGAAGDEDQDLERTTGNPANPGPRAGRLTRDRTGGWAPLRGGAQPGPPGGPSRP